MGMLDILKQGYGMLTDPRTVNALQYLQMRHHGMSPADINARRAEQSYYESMNAQRQAEEEERLRKIREAEMNAAIQGEERSWLQGELADPAKRAALTTNPASLMRAAEAVPAGSFNAMMTAMAPPGVGEYKEYPSTFGGVKYATRVYADGRTERRPLGPVDVPAQPIDDGYHPPIIAKDRASGEAIYQQWDTSRQTYVPVLDGTGKPMLAANLDPQLRQQVEDARATGKATGADTGAAVANLPMAELNAGMQIKQLQQLRMHPGKAGALGMSSILPAVRGSDRADFEARKAQLDGAAFLQAYQTLKGGGQITQIEGEKATAAINRAKATQSEAEFDAAVDELIGMINAATAITREKAGAAPVFDWNGLPDGR